MKYLLSLFLCVLYFGVSAQNLYRNVDVKTEYMVLSYKLFAKKPLTKENTYAEILPAKLLNNFPTAIDGIVNPYLSLDAKRAKKDQPATVTFKYVTEGVTLINDDGNYSVNESGYTNRLSYYKRVSYSCPYKVEVYNEQNQLIKTIVIASADKLFYLQFDKNYLVPEPGLGQSVPPLAFTSNEDANSFYSTNKQKIIEKIEAKCLYGLKDAVRKSVYSIYDYSKFQKSMVWYFEMEKSAQATYPDLFAKTETFKDLLKDFDEPAKKEAAVKGLQEQYDLYMQKLDGGQQLPEDVKQLCRYNGAIAAMYINKMDASKKLYTDFYNKFYLRLPLGIISLPNFFTNLYNYHFIYNHVQNNLDKPVIDVSQSLDDIYYNRFLVDNKLTDERMVAAKKAANPENAGYDEKRNKEILKATWLSYILWNTGNTVHLEPDAYIYKEGTKEIIGQNFLDGSSIRKYSVVTLSGTTGNIKQGALATLYGGMPVSYTWEYNKLSGIKIEGLSDYDYDFIYDEAQQITGMRCRRFINDDIQIVIKAQFNGDKLVKTIKWENGNKGKQEWQRGYKEINYTDTGIVVFNRTYHTGKASVDKNSSTGTAVYRKGNNDAYVVVQPYGVTTENTYNENDDILKSIETKRNGIEIKEFYYYNKLLYKQTTVEKDLSGKLIQTTVQINALPANIPANAPAHEKKIGVFKFSPSGEMTYESNNTQYRTKTNGVWSEWKYFRM
jgi:hypothetical protein